MFNICLFLTPPPVVECGLPPAYPGAILEDRHLVETTYNSRLTYSCQRGLWVARGRFQWNVTCSAAGQWESTFQGCTSTCTIQR